MAHGLEFLAESLLKVYNHTLRKLGDIDFSVERNDVRKRQREGTLERTVRYDMEAFDKAWDWLSSSPSDEEDS